MSQPTPEGMDAEDAPASDGTLPTTDRATELDRATARVAPTAMRVALDAMGGDRAPGEIVLGAVQAAREYGLGVYLVGPEDAIQAELARHDTQGLDLPVVHTDEVIPMDEHNPAKAVRQKKNSSMVRALELVK